MPRESRTASAAILSCVGATLAAVTTTSTGNTSGSTWVRSILERRSLTADDGSVAEPSVHDTAVTIGTSHGALQIRSNHAPFTYSGRPATKYRSVRNATAR